MTTRAALLGGGSRPARRGRSAPGWRRIGSRLGGEHHKIEWSAPLERSSAPSSTLENTGEHLQPLESKGFAGSCYVFTQVYISDIIGHNGGSGLPRISGDSPPAGRGSAGRYHLPALSCLLRATGAAPTAKCRRLRFRALLVVRGPGRRPGRGPGRGPGRRPGRGPGRPLSRLRREQRRTATEREEHSYTAVYIGLKRRELWSRRTFKW